MGAIDDFMKMLDRIPIWKRLGEVPAEVDSLKARVADLEGKLNGKWPADVCRYCGERAARFTSSRGPDDKGIIFEHWTCEKCSQNDRRPVKAR
jgi:hypothetical protein